MRIQSVQNNFQPSYGSADFRQIKKVSQKTKTAIKKCEFMKTPVKYSAIGLLLPIPFASVVGFVIGIGVEIAKRCLPQNNYNKS